MEAAAAAEQLLADAREPDVRGAVDGLPRRNLHSFLENACRNLLGAAYLPGICAAAGLYAEAKRRACWRPSCVCASPHSRGSGPAVKVRRRILVNLQGCEAQLRNLSNLRDCEAQLRLLSNLTEDEAQLRGLRNFGDLEAQSCRAQCARGWNSMTSGLRRNATRCVGSRHHRLAYWRWRGRAGASGHPWPSWTAGHSGACWSARRHRGHGLDGMDGLHRSHWLDWRHW